MFWQWRFAAQRGENWPALAVRKGNWKLLVGKRPQQIELFRFPMDRLEKQNLRDKHPAEARRLREVIDDWEKTLPAKPKSSCFSKHRSK